MNVSNQAGESLVRKEIGSTKFIIMTTNGSRHPIIYYTFWPTHLYTPHTAF